MQSPLKSLLCAMLLASLHAHAESCKDIPKKDEMHAQTVCAYGPVTKEQAYQAALRSNKDSAQFLRKKLPTQQTEDVGESDGSPMVTYQPLTPSKYRITMSFDGGETIWTLLETPKQTKIVFDYYPD